MQQTELPNNHSNENTDTITYQVWAALWDTYRGRSALSRIAINAADKCQDIVYEGWAAFWNSYRNIMPYVIVAHEYTYRTGAMLSEKITDNLFSNENGIASSNRNTENASTSSIDQAKVSQVSELWAKPGKHISNPEDENQITNNHMSM